KNNKKYDECLKFGVACGAAKAEEEGTKMPSIKKIIDKLKEVKIYENFNQGLSYSKTFFSP
ncbi:MAG: hypothetical protein N2589_05060, partial [bacterium]|nr:hypothetical protein [bacterium]